MKAPRGCDVLLLEQQAHLFHAFVEARAALVQLHAEAGELMRQEGPRKADVETPVAQRVQQGKLTGELQWVVECREHRAGDKARGFRVLRRGSEEHHRIRAIAAVWQEVMLNRPHVAIAVTVAQPDQGQRVLPVIAC